jgi:hypothetical protein
MNALKPDLFLREGTNRGQSVRPVLDVWRVIEMLGLKPLLLSGVLGQQIAIVAPTLIRVCDRTIRSDDPDKLGKSINQRMLLFFLMGGYKSPAVCLVLLFHQ